MMRFAFVSVLCLAASAAFGGDVWNQFRGPTGQGTSDAIGLPLTWSETQNIKWSTPIAGKAWSSPVVANGQIWLTNADEKGNKLSVVCVDLATGKVLRDLKLFDVENPQFCIPFNSYASPTPVIEEGRLYATWGAPATACIDTATGKVIWQRRDFVCNHFRGAGSSILIDGERLFMNFDGSDHQFVVALDKKTGKTLWQTKRSVDYKDLVNGQPERDGDWRKAFSTPRLATFEGKSVLVSLGSKCAYGYDPATGSELWRLENNACHSGSPTPFFGHGFIYLCTGIGRSELVAIRPGGAGVLTDANLAWRIKRNVPQRSSPILVDDLIYMNDDGGIATCVDAKTGEVVWRDRIAGAYSASPVYADGKIYFCNETGKTTVIQPGRQFKVLAVNQLGNGFMASPMVVGQALILRSRTHLYRIEKP